MKSLRLKIKFKLFLFLIATIFLLSIIVPKTVNAITCWDASQTHNWSCAHTILQGQCTVVTQACGTSPGECTVVSSYDSSARCPTGQVCSGGTCGAPSQNACASSDCIPACSSTQVCSGTKPNCACVDSGGGGGGGGGGGSTPQSFPPLDICKTENASCNLKAFGSTAISGEQCCPGLVCYGGDHVDESTHTYEYTCRHRPAGGPIQTPHCDATSCDTAVGTIPTSAAGVASKMFTVILSLSGALAVLLIIISGYRLMVSQGNPEKLQAAREQLVAAIIGLLFIIFSLVILETIGVDLLGLTTFSP